MNYPKLTKLSQVKTMSFAQSNADRLFCKFRLSQLLKSSWIIKEKGHTPLEMLFLMLLMILERSRSLYSGIISLQKVKLKNPLNNMLNNEHYNWRKLLYMVARRFRLLCPVRDGKIPVLIIDDTAKSKRKPISQFSLSNGLCKDASIFDICYGTAGTITLIVYILCLISLDARI